MPKRKSKDEPKPSAKPSREMIEVLRHYAEHGSPKHRQMAYKFLEEIGDANRTNP